MRLEVKSCDIFYTWSNERTEHSAPEVNISLSTATESDLVAAKSASPAQADQIDILLRVLRDGETPAPPLRIELVNASEVGKVDKILTVKEIRMARFPAQ